MKKRNLWIVLSIILSLNCTNSIGSDTTENTEQDVAQEVKDGQEPQEELIKVTYKESQQIITNPERGFYAYADFKSNENTTLSENKLREYLSQGISLVYNVYYMYDFQNKPISEAYLQRIRTNMQTLRNGGCKAILRFAYSSDEGKKPWDVPWAITQKHIEQLRPIFQEYADVICVLQAGFIGVWGEWYYTDNYIFEPQKEQYHPRRKLLDALLDALPKERMVCVRYPQAKLYSYNIEPNQTITEQTAYNQEPLSRIGYHNDCFLADKDDTGTFQNIPQYRTYWEKESKFLPMGGETCRLSSFSACTNALSDMEKYHWSYINKDYQTDVIRQWENNNCLDQIKRRLGYRFVLTEGTFSKNAVSGMPFFVEMKLKNVGWAAPFNPRKVEIVLVGNQGSYKVAIKKDPRFWFAGQDIVIKVRFKLPESLKEGTYDVYLNLPDPKESLYSRPEFSIQLANEGIWNASLGYNKLHTIRVTTSK